MCMANLMDRVSEVAEEKNETGGGRKRRSCQGGSR